MCLAAPPRETKAANGRHGGCIEVPAVLLYLGATLGGLQTFEAASAAFVLRAWCRLFPRDVRQRTSWTTRTRKEKPPRRAVKVAARWGLVMGRYATSTPWTVVSVPARSTNLHRKRRLPEPGATRPRGSALPPLGRRSLLYGRPGRRSDTWFAMVGVPASAIGQSTTAQRLSISWTFEKIENGA